MPRPPSTFTNQETHVTERAATDNAGFYSISIPQPGNYALRMEASRFANFDRSAIHVEAGRNITVNVTLNVAGSSQAIRVSGGESPLEQSPALGKTGTALADLPNMISVIDTQLVESQGGTTLANAIGNASGIAQGGSDSFGLADRFLIRGLDARIYNDGFSDGDQRMDFHTRSTESNVWKCWKVRAPVCSVAVPRAEPSTSFTTCLPPPSITAAILKRVPSAWSQRAPISPAERACKGWIFGRMLSPSAPTIFALFQTFVVDARSLEATPDPAGLIYVYGAPITGVPRDTKYSTPFSHGNQTLLSTTLADAWADSPYLTITNRFSYMYRNLLILRNGDGGSVVGTQLTGRQLRAQHDILGDFDYQFEPVWSFTRAVFATLC